MFIFYTNAIGANFRGENIMPNTDSFCQIEWAPEGCRARKVVSRSNYRVTGKYPSWKMGRMMHWESTLERDAFYLLDINPAIREFCEQPAQITYTQNDSEHRHFPDILVRTDHGSLFKEVKTDEEASDEKIIDRTTLLKPLLHTQGFGYELLRESDIRREPRLSNAQRILRYGRITLKHHEQETFIQRYFKNGCSCNLIDITHNGRDQKDIPHLCQMILIGTIAMDIEQPWGNETLFSLQNPLEASK